MYRGPKIKVTLIDDDIRDKAVKEVAQDMGLPVEWVEKTLMSHWKNINEGMNEHSSIYSSKLFRLHIDMKKAGQAITVYTRERDKYLNKFMMEPDEKKQCSIQEKIDVLQKDIDYIQMLLDNEIRNNKVARGRKK